MFFFFFRKAFVRHRKDNVNDQAYDKDREEKKKTPPPSNPVYYYTRVHFFPFFSTILLIFSLVSARILAWDAC